MRNTTLQQNIYIYVYKIELIKSKTQNHLYSLFKESLTENKTIFTLRKLYCKINLEPVEKISK